METVEIEKVRAPESSPPKRQLHPALQANLWKKGQSGNPGGKPKKITNALDRALTREEADMVAKALIRQAKRGNVKAFDSLAERIEGKVPQAITGADGGPVEMAIQVVHVGAITVDDLGKDNEIEVDAINT